MAVLPCWADRCVQVALCSVPRDDPFGFCPVVVFVSMCRYVCIIFIYCWWCTSLFTPTQGIIFFGIIKIFVSGLEKVLHGQRPYGSGGCCCCMLSIILILRVVLLLLLLRRIAGIEMLTTHSVWDHHDGVHVFLYHLGLPILKQQKHAKERRKEGMVRKGKDNDIKRRGTTQTRRNCVMNKARGECL